MKQTIGYPILVTTIALTAFITANLYVWRLQLQRPWQTPSRVSADMLWQNHSIRGWPITVSVSSQRSTYNGRFSAPFGLATIWAGHASDIAVLNGIVLSINLVIGIFIFIGCFFAASTICQKAKWTLRFSLRSSLLMTAICAVAFAIREDIVLIQMFVDAVWSLPKSRAFLRVGILGTNNVALFIAFGWFAITIWQYFIGRRFSASCDELFGAPEPSK